MRTLAAIVLHEYALIQTATPAFEIWFCPALCLKGIVYGIFCNFDTKGNLQMSTSAGEQCVREPTEFHNMIVQVFIDPLGPGKSQ